MKEISKGLTLVNRLERCLLPAIETLTELDLGDGARTEVSNVSGIPGAVVAGAILDIVATIAWVGAIGRRFDNTTIFTEGEGVGL